MCSWDVPLAQRRCGIFVIAEPDNLGHPFLQLRPIQWEIFLFVLSQSTGRVVNRVASKDEKVFDSPVVNVSCELRNLDCFRVTRDFPNNQCLSDIFECCIDRVRK